MCHYVFQILTASANAFSKEINLKRQKLAQFDIKLNELREEQVNVGKKSPKTLVKNRFIVLEIKFNRSFDPNMPEGWSDRNSFDWFHERF